MRRSGIAVATVLAAGTITGCGSAAAPGPPARAAGAPRSAVRPDPSATDTGYVLISVPVLGCEHYWVAGKTFPREYEGCFPRGSQDTVDVTDKVGCGKYFVHEDHQTFRGRYWAVPGGPVHDDPAEARAYAAQQERCVVGRDIP